MKIVLTKRKSTIDDSDVFESYHYNILFRLFGCGFSRLIATSYVSRKNLIERTKLYLKNKDDMEVLEVMEIGK